MSAGGRVPAGVLGGEALDGFTQFKQFLAAGSSVRRGTRTDRLGRLLQHVCGDKLAEHITDRHRACAERGRELSQGS